MTQQNNKVYITDLGTEYSVVAAIWQDPNATCKRLVELGCELDWFSDSTIQTIVREALLTFATAKGRGVTVSSIEARLRDAVRRGDMSDEAYIGFSPETLAEAYPETLNIDELLDRAKRFFTARQTQRIASMLYRKLEQEPMLATELLAAGTGKLLGVASKVAAKSSKPSLALEEWMELPRSGVSTGVKSLDDALSGGLLPQMLYVMAAVTGGGKSSMAKHLAAETIRQGFPCLFFSTEEPKQLIVRKIGANLASFKPESPSEFIDWKAYGYAYEYLVRHNKQPRNPMDQAVLDSMEFMDKRIEIFDDIHDINEVVLQTKLFEITHGSVPVIILDHLHRMDVNKMLSRTSQKTNEAYKEAIYALDDMAKRHNACVIVFGQVSEDTTREWKQKGDVVSFKLKESGDILQAATKGLIFGRGKRAGTTDFRLKKDRILGEESSFTLGYNGDVTRYSELPAGFVDEDPDDEDE